MKQLLFILTFTIALSSYANDNNKKKLKTFSISGNVIDAEGSLTGVKVMLDGKELDVYTDFDGNFTIPNVLEGNHTVTFDMVAYNKKTITVNPKDENLLEVKLYGK